MAFKNTVRDGRKAHCYLLTKASTPVTASTALNILMKGRPAANLTAVVSGVNTITGIPLVSSLVVCPNIDRIV